MSGKGIVEHALGVTLGLLAFTVALWIIAMVVQLTVGGSRYFAPSVHKFKASHKAEEGKVGTTEENSTK